MPSNSGCIYQINNNKEIRTVRGYIPALKIGETTKLNVSMSSNLITAYDIEFSAK